MEGFQENLTSYARWVWRNVQALVQNEGQEFAPTLQRSHQKVFAVMHRLGRIRRMAKRVKRRIKRITRLMATDGPGCRRCVPETGEDYE